MRENLTSLEREYRRYKALAEAAIEQLSEEELALAPAAHGNSVAMLVWHVSGNLKSRFTDFLTSDGEKPWRDRDAEFVPRQVSRGALLLKWEEGWDVLFDALGRMADNELGARVVIRGEPMRALDALHRSVAHASYHVGQIVLLAKSLRGASWQNLSMPRRGASA